MNKPSLATTVPRGEEEMASAAAAAASATSSKKTMLRVLIFPFFATSHIEPFTDLAVRLVAAGPAVEATIAVTPANAPVVQSLLRRRGQPEYVKIATYPFPAVEGLPEGVENLGRATEADAWRIDAAALSEHRMRPAQEALARAQSPDAVVTDVHFAWNVRVAGELGAPCVAFSAIGAFPTLALHHLERVDVDDGDADVVTVPQFPAPSIRVPRAELPEFLRGHERYSMLSKIVPVQDCFCQAMNTSSELERQYCEMYMRHGYAKRAYFVGPLFFSSSSPSPSPAGGGVDDQQSQCIGWLDSKPSRSVVYLCFGSLTHVSDAQLQQLALGLEAAGKPFLWVVRDAGNWTPPEGWSERVGDRGLLVTAWAPQTAILGHPAVGAFVTHCGWNSVLETVMAGVPVLTWPMVFEQFITERLVTEVLGIGERLWPCGAGLRSTRHEEHEVVPAGDVARAVTAFMRPGGAGDAARSRVTDLAAKCRAAVAEGGSSHRDLRRLVDDLMEAKAKRS
ncbi:UDP-glycosyltransferase 73C4-like [Triticum dicoccoides]|uniref:UDP-glycosyltransferase 73C4-like n=1 Tax=Triticum dicoccoides TaxID=85692 RepID=UPI00188F2D0B|nr:UDP-glycosyltransferase 73C4-like [Triticum dicoccoides]